MDHTVSPNLWPDHENLLRLVLAESTPNHPLAIVLHITGTRSDYLATDVSYSVLHVVKEYCAPHQQVQLHSFASDSAVVRRWVNEFSHCYFNFNAGVSAIVPVQVTALREVPEDHLLLEMDSPYFCVTGEQKPNSPAYISDVAGLVAKLRGVSTTQLLDIMEANTRRLFGFY
ncbi:putative metal-dependent hydrolase YcfH [Glandiceps talaboti]